MYSLSQVFPEGKLDSYLMNCRATIHHCKLSSLK